MNKIIMGKLIAKNPNARHNYTIEETIETGIVLSGTEIKSIRAGKVNLKDSYAGIKNGEVIRAEGKGRNGKNGGKNGDLLAKINIANSGMYKLINNDIYENLYITPWDFNSKRHSKW